MKYLIVVAHPDDEVLGAGATIRKLADNGHEVDVCILSGQVEIRKNRPSDIELEEDVKESNKILGVKNIYRGSFPNIRFNTVAHIEMVQFIENYIRDDKIDCIITHHPADLNNDHYYTSIACQAAVRLFQRDSSVYPLKKLLFMEVLSSSEWQLNPSYDSFQPNVYIEVGKKRIKDKIKALSQYRGVMRPYPHPRSDEAILGLAAYRGAQSGLKYAEAFQLAFERREY